MKVLAKSIWYYDLIYKIYDMNMNPGVSWEFIDTLKGGQKANNKKTKNVTKNK